MSGLGAAVSTAAAYAER